MDKFGTYELSDLRARLLRNAQLQPKNWCGRRLALLFRKVFLKTYHGHIIDAELDGLKMRFHLNDNVSERKYLFTPQFFDVDERDLIAKNLPEHGVFIDIGANAGIYTLTAAKYLGALGRVISIEPNPVVRKRLEDNWSFNDFKCQHDILPIGVSDQGGSFDLYLDTTNLGGSSLVEGRKNQEKKIEIKCYPILDVLKDQKIDKIDILKIDIEGAEERALRPFFETADSAVFPDHIIIENDKAQWESGLIDWLTSEMCQYNLIKETRMNIILSKR